MFTGSDICYTPLMLAAIEGDLEMIRMMIDAGANVNAKYSGGKYNPAAKGLTPLAFAVGTGKVKCVKALIEAGANPNYILPPVVNEYGEDLPSRKLTELVKGKSAESILKLLRGEA